MTVTRHLNAFADYPLDKAGIRRRDAGWLGDALAHDGAQLAIYSRMQPFCDEQGVVWLSGHARDAVCGPGALTLFLGVDTEGRPHFAANFTGDLAQAPIAGLGAFEDMRAAATRLPARDSAILGCAKALFEWHARYGFCANCGTATDIADGGWKRVCASCDAEHFPRVDPVVIMLPALGDRCCVGRQRKWPRGMYSAFAGFIEPGESMEEACAREIAEESGLTVTEVRYHSTQPWPFPSSLMIGLICDVKDDVLTLDREEIDEAIWMTRIEARAAISGGATLADGKRVFAPPPLAIAHQLLRAWAGED